MARRDIKESKDKRSGEDQKTGESLPATPLDSANNYVGILVENAPLAMAMFDYEMRYLVANRRWLKEFRLESVHVHGKSQFEVFPDLHDSWKQIYDRCLQGHIERCEEDIFERLDGSRDWVRWEVRPWRKVDFTVGGLIITCEVVTPLKQAEQALKDDRDLAGALLGSSTPVVVLDAAGHVIRHSPGALRCADSRRASSGVLTGQLFTDAFPLPAEIGPGAEGLKQLLQGNSIDQPLVSQTRISDGNLRDIAWAGSQHIDEQGVLSQIVLTGVPLPGAPSHPQIAPTSSSSTEDADPITTEGSIQLGAQAGLAGLAGVMHSLSTHGTGAASPADDENYNDDDQSEAPINLFEQGTFDDEEPVETARSASQPVAAPDVSAAQLQEAMGQAKKAEREAHRQVERAEKLEEERNHLLEEMAELASRLDSTEIEKIKASQHGEELEERLQTEKGNLLVSEHAPFGLVLLDAEGDLQFTNRQLACILGHDIDPTAGIESWLRNACPDGRYASEVISDWQDKVWRRQLTRIFTLSNSEGLLKEIEFRPTLLADGNLLVAVSDVTESRRSEEALRASENRFRRLFMEAPFAIALVDATGFIFDANETMERLVGLSRLELRKSSLDQFIPGTDLAEKRKFLEDMRRRGTHSSAIDISIRPKSGDSLPVRLCVAEMASSDEQPGFTVHFILERHAERAAAAELVESRQQNHALLSMAPDAIILVDLESGDIVDSHCPADFPEHAGLGNSSGKALSRVLPELDNQLAYLLEESDQAADDTTATPNCPLSIERQGRKIVLDCRVARVGDRRCMILARAFPTGVRPGSLASSGSAAAIEEINHRIKNNLQILTSLIGVQLPGVHDEVARRELVATQERLRSIAFLHEHFHSTDDSIDVNFRPYTERLLEHLCSAVGEEDGDGRIAIVADVPDSILPMAKAVPLGLIINELSSNAYKYGFPDERTGSIHVSLKGLDTDEATLRVIDDGIGLPDGFDVEASRGLGFKIVSSLARQVGGRLEFVQSESTEFRVVFPVGDKAQAEPPTA